MPAPAVLKIQVLSVSWPVGAKWGSGEIAAYRAKSAFTRSNIGQEPMIACASRAP